MEDYKKPEKENIDIDIMALLKILVSVIVDVNKQKGQNVVLTNGNNNEVQIPNEQGYGNKVEQD